MKNNIILLPKKFKFNADQNHDAISLISSIVPPFEDKIYVDFSKLDDIEKGDLIVLYALVEKIKAQNSLTRFYLNNPRDMSNEVKKKVNEPIFNKVISENFTVDKKFTRGLNSSELNLKICPKIIDRVVSELNEIHFPEYYSIFNELLTELVANSVEHGSHASQVGWWITTKIINESLIEYAFVDMGGGIIQSHKNAGLPDNYVYSGDSKIVLDSMFGVLISSTKFKNRGQGLQQLKYAVVNDVISNFVLITNTVTLRYKNNEFVATKNEDFKGTYYSWTIDLNNYKKWKSIK